MTCECRQTTLLRHPITKNHLRNLFTWKSYWKKKVKRDLGLQRCKDVIRHEIMMSEEGCERWLRASCTVQLYFWRPVAVRYEPDVRSAVPSSWRAVNVSYGPAVQSSCTSEGLWASGTSQLYGAAVQSSCTSSPLTGPHPRVTCHQPGHSRQASHHHLTSLVPYGFILLP